MTPVRALLAGMIAAVLLGAGTFIAANLAGGRPHDLAPLLSLARLPFSLWCFLAAWGAIVAGALGVLAAFLAFIAPEEEDDPRFRRRGFPKTAPLVLIAVALGLVYFALRCAPEAAAPPIALPVAPDEVAAPVEPDIPADDPITIEPPAAPAPSAIADASSFQWRYKDPLFKDGGPLWFGAGEPFSENAETGRLLCDKAWVAVSGSASEEGPPERNAARARLRTKRAMAGAARWLARHPECGPVIVLGVDLGQHAPVAGIDGDDAASAYQRQILVVSRAAAEGEPPLTVAAASDALRAFLADPESRSAFLAGRIFPAEPQILTP